MDNKTSKEVEDFIVGQQEAVLQYTAPNRHYHPAEKAAQSADVQGNVQVYPCVFTKEFSHWVLVPPAATDGLQRQHCAPQSAESFAVGVGGN